MDGEQPCHSAVSDAGRHDWSCKAPTDTRTVTKQNSTGATSSLTITSREGTNLNIDSITVDMRMGSLTTNVDIAQITYTGTDDRIDNITVSNGAGTIGTIDHLGDLNFGSTVNANVGVLDFNANAINGGTYTSTGDLTSVSTSAFGAGSLVA